MKNALTQNVKTTDAEKASLDAICKKLLSNKVILACILKNCVEEYRDCTLQEIEEKYIEGIPMIAQESLHQDEIVERTNFIKGMRNEDDSIMEGTVTYDIKFESVKPFKVENTDLKETTAVIINIEAQTDFYPGYPLPKRGIYYGSRMISSQYGTIFTNSHYEKIEKVYSIWLCINPPDYKKNSINIYSFHEKHLLGNVIEKKENYDLITIIMICLGDESDDNCKGLIRLLSILFSIEKNAEEKKKILETEFNITMTKKMEKEANEMCDFSRYVEMKAMERGMKKGIEEGIEKGIEQGIAKGEALLASLLDRLFMDGRTEDAMIVLQDEKERKKLYTEYNIIG